MKSKFCLFIISAVLMNLSVSAQQNPEAGDPTAVIIHMKNGSKIEGNVIDWQPGAYIIIETAWGKEVRFGQDMIRKVVQKSTIVYHKNSYNFRETGLYLSFGGQFIAGNNGSRANGTHGLGISASAGHRFNRLLSVGAGVGYDQYIWNSAENIIPLFAEITGFVHPANTSLAYRIQSGFGLAFENEEFLLSEARGGLYFYPSLGIRFGSNPDIKYTLDIGYKFQKAHYTYEDAWQFGGRSEQDILYKRFTIRFGLLL